MILIAFLTVGFVVLFSCNQDHVWDSDVKRARELEALACNVGLTYGGDGSGLPGLPPPHLHVGPMGLKATQWLQGLHRNRVLFCCAYASHALERNGTIHLRFFLRHHGTLPPFRLRHVRRYPIFSRLAPSFFRQYILTDPSGRAASIFRPEVQAWLEIFDGWTIVVPDSTWMIVYQQVPLPPQDVEQTMDRVCMLASLLNLPEDAG